MKKLLFCLILSTLLLVATTTILDVRAQPLEPPTITGVTPATGPNDAQTPLTITGQSFISPATALLDDQPLLEVTYVDSTTLTARVPFGLATGVYTLTVGSAQTVTLQNAFTVTAGAIGWASGGPYGGQTSAIAIHPTATDTVYVTAQLAGLFRTTDGGANWDLVFQTPLNPGPDIEIWSVDPSVVFFTAADGLYRSDQGGDVGSWTLVDMPHGQSIQPGEVAIAPSDPYTMYCTVAGAVYHSDDGGSTWQERKTGLPDEPRYIAIDPDDAGTVYAAYTDEATLYKTTNAGRLWTKLPFTMSAQADHLGTIQSIATDPYRADTLWVGGFNSGFYRSSDGGQTYIDVPSLITVSEKSWFPTITFDPNEDRIYIGAVGPNDAVYTSDDGAATWHGLGLNNQGGMDIAVTPGDSATIYTTWAGVRKTTDGGETWSYLANGIAAVQPAQLTVSPHDPRRVIATADAEGAFGTHNSGNEWTRYVPGPVWEADHYRAAAFDPVSTTVAYLAGGQQLYKSTDDAQTWQATGEMPMPDPVGTYLFAQVQHLTHHPVTPTRLYAGVALGRADSDVLREGALYLSEDGAASWTQITSTGAISIVNRVVFAPSDPAVIYLSTGVGDHGVLGNGIWRSADGGATWEHHAPLLLQGTMMKGLVVHPEDPQVLLAAIWTNPNGAVGITRSTDGGETWQATAGLLSQDELKVTEIAYDPGDPSILYAATHGGLRVSFDSGRTWRPYPGAAGSLPITAMTVTADENGTRLYLGTVGGTITEEAASRLAVQSTALLGAGVYVGQSRWYSVALPLILRR